MKKCFKCCVEKDLSEYYKHKQMADGHLNKCKECTKKDVKSDYNEKKISSVFIEKERKRGREKYRKFAYKRNKDKAVNDRYCEKFPEKEKAKSLSQHLSCKKGFQKHHWSYRLEFAKDVIEVVDGLHQFYHRFLNYDQENMMYRTICAFENNPSGILLDSKGIHERYIKFCEVNFEK